MIFFLAHYIFSPLLSRERLRTKAWIKLFVSAALFVFALNRTLGTFFVPLEATDIDKFLLGPFCYYLTAETFLDCVCFSLLLASNYEVHQDQGAKQEKRR